MFVRLSTYNAAIAQRDTARVKSETLLARALEAELDGDLAAKSASYRKLRIASLTQEVAELRHILSDAMVRDKKGRLGKWQG